MPARDPIAEAEPWLPEGLDVDDVARGSYITIDELEDRSASAHVTPWPVIDAKRRLRFPDRRRGFTVGADARRVAAIANRYRDEPRPLRTGDVFWAVVRRPPRLTARIDLADIVARPLLDVTVPAREAAKTQYFAAVAAVLDTDDVAQLFDDLMEPG
jgi:hypothetical protein